MTSCDTRIGVVRTGFAILGLALGLSACSMEQAPSQPAAPLPNLATATIVDLSHTYDENTLYWPTSPSRFELEPLHHGPTADGFFYSAHSLATPEHGGTHLDAPIHFREDGWTAAEVPLERLIAPAVVIDVTAESEADPDYRLSVERVLEWESEHGGVPVGSIVLLRTGWSSRWPDAASYLGDDTPGDASNLHFPGFSEEAVRLLANERAIATLGIDTASIDHGPSRYFLAHQAAAASNIPALENVTNLDRLPPTGAWVFALPMKIGGGSGGPVRIAALVPAG